MSLYRAGLRLALFLPLGIAIAKTNKFIFALGFTDVSPVIHFTFTSKGDPCVDRTRVRKFSAFGSTCLFRQLI